MLQQTAVKTVIPYFERWMIRWPTLEKLAQAPLPDILHAWQGLGYYTRARNLHACAQQLAEGGFPKTEKLLRQLPGIGPYTAAAIRTIAFDQPAVAVDGNITRVLSRYGGIEATGSCLTKAVHQLGKALLPTKRWGDYTQALMDLGAIICVPQKPHCNDCPISSGCYAAQQNKVSYFPIRKKQLPIPQKHGDAFWIERQDGALFFEKESQKRLLQGLFRFPFSAFQSTPITKPTFPFPGNWIRDPEPVIHTFTHFKLFLTIWRLSSAETPCSLTGQWILRKNLHIYPLSTLMKKVLRFPIKKEESPAHDTP